MSTDGFRLSYFAKAVGGVPRDLFNTVASTVHPIRPTVLIYNCTWVCDARCEMCSNWKHGDRKSDMALDQLDGAMNHSFWGAVENLNILGRRADDPQRSPGNGRTVPPAAAPPAENRHQHDGPDTASGDPDG